MRYHERVKTIAHLILVLCSAVTLSAQAKPTTAADYNGTLQYAVSETNAAFPFIFTVITENFNNGKLVSTKTEVAERQAQGIERETSTLKKGGKTLRSFSIQVGFGNATYCSTDGEKWTGPQKFVCPGPDETGQVRLLGPRPRQPESVEYSVEEKTLGGQPVKVYRKYAVYAASSPGGKKDFQEEIATIDSRGFFVSVVDSEGTLDPKTITLIRTQTWDFKTKIAPVLAPKQNMPSASTPQRIGRLGNSDSEPGLNRPLLKDEILSSEVEPRSRLFQMNVRFARGTYSVPKTGNDPKAHQYIWSYYPDADLVVQFFEYAAGSFPASPDESKREAAKMFEASMLKGGAEGLVGKDATVDGVSATRYEMTKDGKKFFGRTFIKDDVWYVLLASPKIDEGVSAIHKAFDSFVFVKTANPVGGLENGVFRSTTGKFSIAIPALPARTLDNATTKARILNVDVGKQFVWNFGRTFYTAYYTTPVNHDGDPTPQLFEDIETGTRKGVLNAGATLQSEKPIQLGKHRGTEFRYSSSNGVRFINRVFLIGDRGYQIMGGYADANDEQKVIDVLNTFTPFTN